VGVAVFWTACRMLRVEEMDLAAQALARPIERFRAKLL
jgi:hypothetical protein